MKFLITGANGFVGKPLCAELLRRGDTVCAAVRTAVSPIENIEMSVVGSIDGATDWSAALAGIDAVIHLAARVHVMHESAANPLDEFRRVNVAGTEQLARAAAASGVKRLVYVSSIKVNGEETHSGQHYKEADVPSPQDPYGISKWEAEQALHRVAAETGLEVVIVRPPLIYGAGVKGNFAQMLKVLAKGIPLPLASVSNLRSLVYLGNFVDALLICATHPAAAGQTYLVSDVEDVSTPALLRQLGAAMGQPARLLPCPPVLLKLAGRIVGRSDQIDRLLGWQPPFTVQEGLRLTVSP